MILFVDKMHHYSVSVDMGLKCFKKKHNLVQDVYSTHTVTVTLHVFSSKSFCVEHSALGPSPFAVACCFVSPPKALKSKTDQTTSHMAKDLPKLSQMDVHGANRSTSHDGIFQKLAYHTSVVWLV